MSIVTLLNWSADNGIRVQPNLRILHRHGDKRGIYVCVANYPIIPKQSRKRFSLTLAARYSLLLSDNDPVIHLSSSVVVSCRNTEIRRAVHPFMCIS